MNKLQVSVLLEKNGIIALNKPPGVSSDKHLNDKVPSMEARMQKERPEMSLAHRIDLNTSGLLLFAESQKRCLEGKSVYFWLRNNWHKAVTKRYLAIMKAPDKDTFFCDEPLFNEDKGRLQLCKTTFTVLDVNWEGWALVLVDMEYGRKHQIRKHGQKMGYPLLGDVIYGGVRTPHRNGQMLHAWRMEVRLPGYEVLNLEAPVPADFMKFNFDWDKLKNL